MKSYIFELFDGVEVVESFAEFEKFSSYDSSTAYALQKFMNKLSDDNEYLVLVV